MASNSEMMEELEALRKTLDRIAEGGKPVGVITQKSEAVGKCIVTTGQGSTEISLPDNFEVRVGETVTIHPMSGQIFSKAFTTIPGGIVKVHEVLDGGLVEIEGPDMHRVVMIGPGLEGTLKKGFRVMLDSTGHVALANLGAPAAHFLRGETTVDWSEIGGLEDVKRELIEAIEHPHVYPEIYASYNQKPPKGLAMSGPPGNGKTMCGKAVATALSRIYNKGAKTKTLSSAFLYVKGPEILSKWVGEAESNIRQIFERAREHKAEHGFPATIFIDEADAILSKRGTGVSSDMEKTIVPMFLSEMDGLDEASAIIILATNRVMLLDPAIMRDGRIDRKIFVPRPDERVTKIIMQLNLKKIPLAGNVSAKDLAEVGTETLFSSKRSLGHYGTKGAKMELFLRDCVSGATVKNVVDIAVSSAIRRDIEKGSKKKPSGVNEHDMLHAVDTIMRQQAHADHSDVLDELKERHEQAPARPPKQAQAVEASA